MDFSQKKTREDSNPYKNIALETLLNTNTLKHFR